MEKVRKKSKGFDEGISQWTSSVVELSLRGGGKQTQSMHYRDDVGMETNSMYTDDDEEEEDVDKFDDGHDAISNLSSHIITENESNCSKGLRMGVSDGLTRRERKNRRRRESIQCPTCGKTINRGSMSKHAKTHTRVKKFQCEICGGGYDRQDYFMKHMALHIDKKPYKCSVCGKAFNLARKLISHETIHTGLKPFICSLCHTSFTESSALYKHMRGMHEGNKPYECSFCGKSFNESAKVKRHMRIHTGEKPFVCSICGRAFNDRSAQLKHIRTHKVREPTPASVSAAMDETIEAVVRGCGSSNGYGGGSSNGYGGGSGGVDDDDNTSSSTILAKLLTVPYGVDIKQEIESEIDYELNLPPIHSYYLEEQEVEQVGFGGSCRDDDDNNNNIDEDGGKGFVKSEKTNGDQRYSNDVNINGNEHDSDSYSESGPEVQ